MNKRIGELAEQAALLGPGSRIGNAHEATEKFAQLILKECITICEDGKDTQMTSIGAADRIRTTFGIK
jgi:hypothetical protein